MEFDMKEIKSLSKKDCPYSDDEMKLGKIIIDERIPARRAVPVFTKYFPERKWTRGIIEYMIERIKNELSNS